MEAEVQKEEKTQAREQREWRGLQTAGAAACGLQGIQKWVQEKGDGGFPGGSLVKNLLPTQVTRVHLKIPDAEEQLSPSTTMTGPLVWSWELQPLRPTSLQPVFQY